MKYISRSFIRWASLGFSLVVVTAHAQTVHISHCMAGCPVYVDEMKGEANELIVRQLYVASINAQSGLADWQAYRVLADSVGVASLLPRVWYEDSLASRAIDVADPIDNAPQFVQSVSSDAEERNYQLSEITLLSEDQGRLVPMTSFAGTPYWSELNFLSNMSPLPFDLRVGSWSRLDQSINALADEIGEVYVVSGPIYDERSAEQEPVKPSAYFKIISTDDAVSAFIFDSEIQQHVNFCDHVSTLQAVEEAVAVSMYPQKESAFTDTLHAELSCTF